MVIIPWVKGYFKLTCQLLKKQKQKNKSSQKYEKYTTGKFVLHWQQSNRNKVYKKEITFLAMPQPSIFAPSIFASLDLRHFVFPIVASIL